MVKKVKNQEKYDVVVVGAGASGLMVAGRAGELGWRVLLLEKNRALGEKLNITGGGRCNITNAIYDKRDFLKIYGPAQDFLFSPFSQFGVKDTFAFFERLGLPLVVEART
ncbi:MAG TPA: NAD(P)/FAD-dependent oxidoreductase, partial [Candidatus Paceibacterota bacterium]|nr:NAD(P)/FAD-dependent oxidoreductase [Candidatus Paceibacterota bacterium]